MKAPELSMAMVSNVWCKQMHFKNAGDFMEGHTHTHDHLTLLAHGSVEVDIDGNTQNFSAPHMIFISKGKRHHLKALEPGTVAYCVHALRDENEDILDGDIIPEAVKRDAERRILSEPNR